jgi:hypothetical protein
VSATTTITAGHQPTRLELFERLEILFEILDIVRMVVNVVELEPLLEFEPRQP